MGLCALMSIGLQLVLMDCKGCQWDALGCSNSFQGVLMGIGKLVLGLKLYLVFNV